MRHRETPPSVVRRPAPPTVAVVKVSTRGDYASRALLSLALHSDESGPTSVRDIAERTGLPQPYLEQILLALKGAGLVRSKRGVGGGYVLSRDPSQISLATPGGLLPGRFYREGHKGYAKKAQSSTREG